MNSKSEEEKNAYVMFLINYPVYQTVGIWQIKKKKMIH